MKKFPTLFHIYADRQISPAVLVSGCKGAAVYLPFFGGREIAIAIPGFLVNRLPLKHL